MGQVQQITIRLEGLGTEPVAPPGVPKLWDVLRLAIGPVRCFRSQSLFVEWSPKALDLPTPAQWEQWLTFRGLSELSIAHEVDAVTLQIRRRGLEPDSISTLARELLVEHGFAGAVESLGFVRQFEFYPATEETDPKTIAALSDAVNKVLSLGARTGIFHPAMEEARVIVPGPIAKWPAPGDAIRNKQDFEALFRKDLADESNSPLRTTFRLSEFKPRAKTAFSEDLRNPISIVQEVNIRTRLEAEFDPEVDKSPQSEIPSPLGFLVSMPQSPDAYSSIEKFRYRLENLAAQYDRSVGSVVFRDASPGRDVVEAWSHLPLNNRTLGLSPSSQHQLWMLGPWDSRNPVVERRIEVWLKECPDARLIEGEVLDGEQNWISYLGSVLARENSGWILNTEAMSPLVRENLWRTRRHRVWFFWHEGDSSLLTNWGKHLGIPLYNMAKRDAARDLKMSARNGDVLLKISLMDLLDSQKNRDQSRVAKWVYPELKSPTYGFDRVALFPAEYMIKVAFRDEAEEAWAHEARLFFSGDRFRSVTFRNPSSRPLNGFRWSDGERIWAESFGSREGWMNVDPRAAGMAAVDSALRILVSLGAKPVGCSGKIWIAQPDEFNDDSEESRKQWGAYVLALEGASKAADAFRVNVESLNGGGVGYPGVKQELFVNLRAALKKDAQAAMPGFRMTGEALYIVGPKPAFVDAGSRVLSHVTKVISNHVSKFAADAQIELYMNLYELLRRGTITSIRAVSEGGVAGTIAEMSIWGGIGAQVRPALSPIELFSSSPGRFVVGILPQEVKTFESTIKSELLTVLGTSGGVKVCGVPISKLIEARMPPS